MKDRRPLTPAERRAAEAFARYVELSPKSHQAIAEEVGVTPSALGHWFRGEIPIPLRRAGAAAMSVGATPEEICPEWQAHIAPFLNRTDAKTAPAAASHPAGLDPAVLELAGEVAEAIAGKKVDPRADARLISLAYSRIVELAGKPIPAAVIVDITQRAQEWGYGGKGGGSTRISG